MPGRVQRKEGPPSDYTLWERARQRALLLQLGARVVLRKNLAHFTVGYLVELQVTLPHCVKSLRSGQADAGIGERF